MTHPAVSNLGASEWSFLPWQGEPVLPAVLRAAASSERADLPATKLRATPTMPSLASGWTHPASSAFSDGIFSGNTTHY